MLNFDHQKDLQSEKRRHIAMIDELNGKLTISTSEVKMLQSDKETGKCTFHFHIFIHSDFKNRQKS